MKFNDEEFNEKKIRLTEFKKLKTEGKVFGVFGDYLKPFIDELKAK
jgi:hypothetical protein